MDRIRKMDEKMRLRPGWGRSILNPRLGEGALKSSQKGHHLGGEDFDSGSMIILVY